MTLSTSFYYPDGNISSNVKMNVGHGWSTFTGLWEIESTEDNNNVRLKNFYSREYLSLVENKTISVFDRYVMSKSYRKVDATLWTLEKDDCESKSLDMNLNRTVMSNYKKRSPSLSEIYKSYKYDSFYLDYFRPKHQAVKNDLLLSSF